LGQEGREATGVVLAEFPSFGGDYQESLTFFSNND
jgi:hypothetical protein